MDEIAQAILNMKSAITAKNKEAREFETKVKAQMELSLIHI
mgnify:FL=1